MTSEPSSASRDINPYAASHVAKSQETPVTPQQSDVARTYQIRMEWADRDRFLRSVGLLRIAAVAGAVMGFYGLYGLLSSFYLAWQAGNAWIWSQPFMAGRWLFVIAKAAVGFYVCWLHWALADALAETAGGKTGRMERWSVLQYRFALLGVIVIALAALSLGWDWFMVPFLWPTRFGG